MNIVYDHASDKNVKYVLMFGHSDNKLYHDKEHKTPVTKAEMDDVLYSRLLIEVAGVHYNPVSVKKAAEDEVVIITNSSTTPSAATYKTSSGK